jgi:putative restriction endonuclease
MPHAFPGPLTFIISSQLCTTVVALCPDSALTRLQKRLVEAAHILPVGAPGSIDNVINGIALSPTYHEAFDDSLIFLDDEYTMRINPYKERQLRTLRLDGGLADFKAFLGKKIHLPPDVRQWPDKNFIRLANKVRRVG